MSEKEFLRKLGKNIKKIRKSKGIKQIELAYDCDFEGSNMSRIEAGRINISVKLLLKIAKSLDVDFKDLIDF